ncbi:GntR family transcriptional regulator [Clostridium weizhouense]|uniref:GntR family transcriptional regulator n=1 Tax=Clostridium weizhouense TaxID=2859781 RepID=A0ABS7AJ75_9CLOT|nr:GntR family transcriptional regulator [Clostridium weizhouense]MBW6408711.1 GntR family transcriptional regulator [Clostridium weizhouense]
MIWEFKDERPIYIQLVEQIQLRIVSGVYGIGEKLPSVRDLASEASVNPNTMQKALTELERKGLVFSQRTSGRFITEDGEMIKKMRDDIAKEQIQDFFENMKKIGYTPKETIEIVEQIVKEMK